MDTRSFFLRRARNHARIGGVSEEEQLSTEKSFSPLMRWTRFREWKGVFRNRVSRNFSQNREEEEDLIVPRRAKVFVELESGGRSSTL